MDHRAIALISTIDDACAQEIRPSPGGHALLDPRHPQLWSANHLRVEGADPPTAAALAAAADRHLDAQAAQTITVHHEVVGRARPLAARRARVSPGG